MTEKWNIDTEKRTENNREMEESEMREKNRDTAEKLDTELETRSERPKVRKHSTTGTDRQTDGGNSTISPSQSVPS